MRLLVTSPNQKVRNHARRDINSGKPFKIPIELTHDQTSKLVQIVYPIHRSASADKNGHLQLIFNLA